MNMQAEAINYKLKTIIAKAGIPGLPSSDWQRLKAQGAWASHILYLALSHLLGF